MEVRIEQPQGTMAQDQTFSGEFVGSFNTSLMWRWIDAGSLFVSRALVPIGKSWVETSKLQDVNPLRLATMTEQDMTPLLLMEGKGKTASLLDGCHRLRWLIDNGYGSFRAIIVPYESAQMFRIRFYEREGPDVPWREIPNERMSKFDWGKFPQHKHLNGGVS